MDTIPPAACEHCNKLAETRFYARQIGVRGLFRVCVKCSKLPYMDVLENQPYDLYVNKPLHHTRGTRNNVS